MEEPFFTDIHSHFLYGVDDGSRDLRQSLGMLDQARSVGIKQLIATPHATELMNHEVSQQFLDHFNTLQQAVRKSGLDVEVYLGSELFFTERIYDWLDYPWATLNNNKKYILFEIPLYDLPDRVGDFIFQSRLQGLTPILAHPERYIYLHDKLDTLFSWYRQGCLMQMNGGSLIGQFGDTIAELTKTLLKAGLYNLAGSDAHNEEYRNYHVLRKAFDVTGEIISQEKARELFIDNTDKALHGQLIIQEPLNEDILKAGEGRLKTVMKHIRSRFYKK